MSRLAMLLFFPGPPVSLSSRRNDVSSPMALALARAPSFRLGGGRLWLRAYFLLPLDEGPPAAESAHVPSEPCRDVQFRRETRFKGSDVVCARALPLCLGIDDGWEVEGCRRKMFRWRRLRDGGSVGGHEGTAAWPRCRCLLYLVSCHESSRTWLSGRERPDAANTAAWVGSGHIQ